MNTRKLSISNLVTVAAVLLASVTMLVPVGAANIGVTGFQTPSMSGFVPSISVAGSAAELRNSMPAPLSEIFALFPPPVNVTGQPSEYAPLSEIFALFPPPVKVTGQPSEYAPLSEIFALFPPPVKVPPSVIARHNKYGPFSPATGLSIIHRQYEYGPAILATGFASPTESGSYGVYPNVPWWH